MPILTVILAIVGAIFLFSSIIKFARKEKGQTFFKLGASIVIWGSIFVFALFPELTHQLSSTLGMGENLNTLIFLGFVVIFMIIYKLIHTIEKLERNISELVRKEALRDFDKKI